MSAEKPSMTVGEFLALPAVRRDKLNCFPDWEARMGCLLWLLELDPSWHALPLVKVREAFIAGYRQCAHQDDASR